MFLIFTYTYWVDYVYRGKIEMLHLADTTNTADYWNKVKTLTFNIPKYYNSEPKPKSTYWKYWKLMSPKLLWTATISAHTFRGLGNKPTASGTKTHQMNILHLCVQVCILAHICSLFWCKVVTLIPVDMSAWHAGDKMSPTPKPKWEKLC